MLRQIVSYIANELIRIFQYEYVSTTEAFTDSDDGAEFLCSMSIGFIDFLVDITELVDEWRRACALFVIMVADFERFVEAYRNEDAIMIECGYKYFLPILFELGQNAYVERVFFNNLKLFIEISRIPGCRNYN